MNQNIYRHTIDITPEQVPKHFKGNRPWMMVKIDRKILPHRRRAPQCDGRIKSGGKMNAASILEADPCSRFYLLFSAMRLFYNQFTTWRVSSSMYVAIAKR